MFKYFFAIFCPLLCIGTTTAQNIFDSRHTLQYAHHLFEHAEYEEAAAEYQRVLKLQPDNYSVLDSCLIALRNAKAYKQTVRLLQELFPEAGRMPQKYHEILIINAIRVSDFYLANAELQTAEQKNGLNVATYHIAIQILKGDYECASIYTPEDFLADRQIKLIRIADSLSRHASRKRPYVQAIAAVLIPGSGHFVLGDAETGIQYFLLVGINCFQAWKTYENASGPSIYPVVFGAAALGFYVGNIHGAVQEVKRVNRAEKQQIEDLVFEVLESKLDK